MHKNDRRTRLACIEPSALGKVTGGGLPWDTWGWYLSSPSCRDAVYDGAAWAGYKVGGSNIDSWGADAWAAADNGANQAWNGPACSNYGWW